MIKVTRERGHAMVDEVPLEEMFPITNITEASRPEPANPERKLSNSRKRNMVNLNLCGEAQVDLSSDHPD